MAVAEQVTFCPATAIYADSNKVDTIYVPYGEIFMCRSKNDNGKRCNGSSRYAKQRRALQAKKQYYTKKLAADSSDTESFTKALDATLKHVALTFEHKNLGNGIAHRMPLTPNTEKLVNAIEQAGFSPYIVGGSVRDSLLGVSNIKDIDIEVHGATTEQLIPVLKTLGNVDEVGKSFGVLKITLDGEEYDVSLPRTETKTRDGHTGFDIEVDPDLGLERASLRRDYTINALAYSAKHEYVIDHHTGLKDLKDKKLKHVSDAFDEDPLRVLRGMQMAARFDMSLAPETVTKSQKLQSEFHTLSEERVRGEFGKLWGRPTNIVAGFKALQETGWGKFVGLEKSNNKKLWDKLSSVNKTIESVKLPKKTVKLFREILYAATVAESITDDGERNKFVELTSANHKSQNAIKFLVNTPPAKENMSSYEVEKLSHNLSKHFTVKEYVTYRKVLGENTDSVETVAVTAGVYESPKPDLVTGKLILEQTNKKPGKWVGDLVAEGRDAQHRGVIKNMEDATGWLLSHI
jgi:tRNA nucleotidyltransferase/poly(A) polymerase